VKTNDRKNHNKSKQVLRKDSSNDGGTPAYATKNQNYTIWIVSLAALQGVSIMSSTSIDEAQNLVLGLKRQLQQVPVGSNNWYGVQLQLVPATKELECLVLEEQQVTELVSGY
jgi:hypothetical protein